MSGRGRPQPQGSTGAPAEAVLAKLLAATAEARETTQSLHQARRDVNTDWAALRQWLATEETVRAFREARSEMQQWVTDELTRIIQAEANEALIRLDTEVAQLIPMYAKKMEDTFQRIARRIVNAHGLKDAYEGDDKEPPDDLRG